MTQKNKLVKSLKPKSNPKANVRLNFRSHNNDIYLMHFD